MIKVIFVCHGNICRSPMAEFVLKAMVKEKGIEENFVINSSARVYKENWNPVHRGTRKKLKKWVYIVMTMSYKTYKGRL